MDPSHAARNAGLDAAAPRPTVLVTGGARRVGRAIALELAAAGCNLALTYRASGAECAATAADARRVARDFGHAIDAQAIELDLADERSVDRAAAEVAARGCDAIVHNASEYRATPFGQLCADDLERMHRVEVVGPMLLTQALRGELSRSRIAGGGAVVFFSDIYALGRPRAGYAAYLLAKAGVRALSEQLALELAPQVRVNCIAPGVVMWPEGFPEETKQAILARTPLARAGEPEEAARLVRFLVLEATFMTGETMRIDGGRSLR